MSGERSERPKSPWASGDMFEAKLGPEEVEKIRNRHKINTSTVESEDGLGALIKSLDQELLQDFRANLIGVGGTFSKTYAVENNHVRVEKEAEDNPSILDLVTHATPTAKLGNIDVYTPDDLRSAARLIMEKHPDIVFEFQETPSRDVFSYTVTLKKNEE